MDQFSSKMKNWYDTNKFAPIALCLFAQDAWTSSLDLENALYDELLPVLDNFCSSVQILRALIFCSGNTSRPRISTVPNVIAQLYPNLLVIGSEIPISSNCNSFDFHYSFCDFNEFQLLRSMTRPFIHFYCT
jgi:hypothetical protein